MRRMAVTLLLCVVSAVVGAAIIQGQQTAHRASAEEFSDIQRLLWDNHMGYDFTERDNGDLWTSTFLPDARIDNDAGTHLSGTDEIRKYAIDPIKKNPNRRLRHWTSTFRITPNAEGAVLEAFWFTISDDGKSGMTIGGTGRYESQVVKTKQGWKIKHHVIHSEGPGVFAKTAATAAR